MSSKASIFCVFTILALTIITGCGSSGGGGGIQEIINTNTSGATVSGRLQGDNVASVPVFLIKESNNTASIKSNFLSMYSIANDRYETITDNHGYFTFINVITGNYKLIAQSSRFSQGSVLISVSDNQDVINDVAVTISPTGDLSGNLKVPNGFSTNGIQVFLAGTSYSSFLNSIGSFTISGIPEGNYEIFASSNYFGLTALGSVSILPGKINTISSKSLSYTYTNNDFISERTIRYGEQLITFVIPANASPSLSFTDISTGKMIGSIQIKGQLPQDIKIAGINALNDIILFWWDGTHEIIAKVTIATGIFVNMGTIGDLSSYSGANRPYMYNNIFYFEGGSSNNENKLYVFDTSIGKLVNSITINPK